jgi:uncharacterized membrane protein
MWLRSKSIVWIGLVAIGIFCLNFGLPTIFRLNSNWMIKVLAQTPNSQTTNPQNQIIAQATNQITTSATPGSTNSDQNQNPGSTSPGSEKTYDARLETLREDRCLIDPSNRCIIGQALIFTGSKLAEKVDVQVRVLDGTQLQTTGNLKAGDKVFVTKIKKPDGSEIYVVQGPNRQSWIWILGIGLVLFTVLVARVKGIMAIVALTISTALVVWWLLPNLLTHSTQILWYGLATCVMIVVINQLIGHGFNTNSYLGLASSLIALIFTTGLSLLLGQVFKITGLGGDGIDFLRTSVPVGFSFTDLFLVTALLSSVGALDDVTTSQATAVEEIAKANTQDAKPTLSYWTLFSSGMRVGTEHLVSMINTLFLAYLGVALPTLLVFQILSNQDVFVILSREDITEEIIRSAVANFGLILAIPLTNALAAWVYLPNRPKLSRFFSKRPKIKHL